MSENIFIVKLVGEENPVELAATSWQENEKWLIFKQKSTGLNDVAIAWIAKEKVLAIIKK